MTMTVIQFVLERLKAIGISDIFGVPGDYSFPVNDAICNDPHIRWIGCSNELNAAYAADGYARVKGVAALCTTYGVGELSALNGVAGAYAEHLPIFHLVGTPSMAIQSARAPMHHTLGNGEYDLFRRMTELVVCAYAVMTPQNVAFETERLIAEALFHRRPVYMAFPADLAEQPVLGTAEPLAAPRSNPDHLAQATTAILSALEKAETACVLPGNLIHRCGLQRTMQNIIDRSGLPFATMFMDKSVLDEHQPAFVGMYDGALMNDDVRQFVEDADCVLTIGTLMSDLNSGAFTARLDPARTITIAHHNVLCDGKTYIDVEMGDILRALAENVPHRGWKRMSAPSLGAAKGSGDDPIGVDALYPRWADFLSPGDILVAETGTASMGLGFARMPKGATFYNQTLWGSIGWATPAAVGAAIAAPGRRVVLVTGDGSHQMTATEIGLFGHLGLKPIVFVLNNNGYLIERLLCKNPEIAYNDIAPWRYSELPHALGCDGWLTARVTTCAELDAVLAKAKHAETGVYIEIVTDTYAASPLAMKLHENLKSLYKS
ncbi:alpha-keto acid decarboxylase family protein [Beijerinckia indica]|uniref:Thiamine pyrophosphate protein TPP binding domain protein n=1 Tax=Beijerinckia indica subsp. indica (strain ATCC 9039 / DSM 1715 / NCIMB 8712) TaxID=395963 RepID=B2IDI6_BEII9|nr:thiamine pyrophosphate-binding protein [Beijerinckia indica]ACB95422.1 thiamine pyrophosphate protein TPP binding domain protein [Beijerinckia indica subsp. indica ATCC 9039]